MKKEVTVYLCGIDWQHEVGESFDGNNVYSSLESLKENHKCWEECGVVRCKLSIEEWVVEQDEFGKSK